LRHKIRRKFEQAQNITQANFAKYYSTLETNWKRGTESETETYSDEGEFDPIHNYHAVKTYTETGCV